ncbi:MAG: hypothetical protein JKX76_01080 [Colwellia sp.]|nr:hypothetical protein [Colwellia sp.]
MTTINLFTFDDYVPREVSELNSQSDAEKENMLSYAIIYEEDPDLSDDCEDTDKIFLFGIKFQQIQRKLSFSSCEL